MRRLAVLFFAACASMGVMAQNSLSFDPSSGRKASLTFHDGSMVNYVAYERLFYVANVEDSTYQYLNVFVPDGATLLSSRPYSFVRMSGGIWHPKQACRRRAMPPAGL